MSNEEDFFDKAARDAAGVRGPNFDDFAKAIRALLDGAAAQKSYNKTGVDGPNDLFDFVEQIAGDGHALGEIVYKVKRYHARKNPEDILKIAAWAFLIWRKHNT
jgi:hypothetical protein